MRNTPRTMGRGTKLVTCCVIAGACAILNGYRHTRPRWQERRMDDADDELSNLVKSYKKDGYVVLPGLLDPVEIRSLGELVNTEIARGTLGPRVGATSGYYTSDASRHPGLKQIDTYLYSNPQLLRALSGVFGCDNCYRRLPRNDLMADCAGAPKWHRDRMQGSISDYVGVPQFITNSSDEALYHLVNVGFYFEDHSHDDAGLWVVPGSQKKQSMDKVDSAMETNSSVVIKSKVGDVIVWDWRTFHRGGFQCDGSTARGENEQHRMLFAGSVGLKNAVSEVMARVLEWKYDTETMTAQQMSSSGCNGTSNRIWKDCLVRHVKESLRLRPLSKEQQQIVEMNKLKAPKHSVGRAVF